MRRSLSSRLATLYALLLGVTVLIVIAASSIALIYELSGFSSDIIIAKHQEARFLSDRYEHDGIPLQQAAPRIARALSGIGLHVAIYDAHGKFLGGDPTVRPEILARVLRGAVKLQVAPIRLNDSITPVTSRLTAPARRRSDVIGGALRRSGRICDVRCLGLDHSSNLVSRTGGSSSVSPSWQLSLHGLSVACSRVKRSRRKGGNGFAGRVGRRRLHAAPFRDRERRRDCNAHGSL